MIWYNCCTLAWYNALVQSPNWKILTSPYFSEGLYSLSGKDVVPSNPVKSRSREMGLYWSYSFEIWQATRQPCCRGACQISERLEKFKPESRGFETLRDLTVRRLSASCMEAQNPDIVIHCQWKRVYRTNIFGNLSLKGLYLVSLA